MTVTVPKWAIAAVGIVVVAVVAFLIGRGSGGDEDNSGSTSAPAEAAGLECNNHEMTTAVSSGELADAVRELGAVAPTEEVLDVYRPDLLDCVDMTGDGVEEMIVELLCCAGGAPIFPWAIFKQEAAGWTAALIRTRMPAPELDISEDGVTETTPAFADGDARCCPSGQRVGGISWNGSKFTFKPQTGTADRSIALDGDTPQSVGGLAVQTANLQEAIRVFGVPSEYFRDDEICPAHWRDIGLRIDFVNLGGANPCGPEGAIGGATVGGFEGEQVGWQTGQGATIGMSQEELLGLYPDMQAGAVDAPQEEPDFPGRIFYLVTRPSVIGEGGTTPSLAARLDTGTVTAYELYVGAGGE